MDDLLTKGYASKLTEDEAAAGCPRTWHLPHHGVFHSHKPGKIRVLLDASALLDVVSLNSQLNRGPDLSLRFRKERIALAQTYNLCSFRLKYLPKTPTPPPLSFLMVGRR